MAATDVFIPPSVAPQPRQLPYWRAIRTVLDNPIEAWPRQVYEEKMWAPPDVIWRVLYVTDREALRAEVLRR